MHLLVATDGSQTAIDAAQLAVGLFDPDNVTLLTVLASVPGENVDEVDEPAFTPEEQAREWEAEMAAVNRELARVHAVLTAPHVDTRVEAGDVAWTISRVAREVDVDLIVLGAHMRHGHRHMFRRSVAERVVRDAPCTVLVVRDQALGV
jgi:nucleotide-binding universal stress UspA family protein